MLGFTSEKGHGNECQVAVPVPVEAEAPELSAAGGFFPGADRCVLNICRDPNQPSGIGNVVRKITHGLVCRICIFFATKVTKQIISIQHLVHEYFFPIACADEKDAH